MNYKWGFKGKENDREVLTGGRFQDYGFRAYRPDLARFFAVDPLRSDYPELTTYQFASNTPIQAIDLDGLEAWMTRDGKPSSVNGPLNKEFADKNGLVPFASSKPPESPKVPTSDDVSRKQTNSSAAAASKRSGISISGQDGSNEDIPKGSILHYIPNEIIEMFTTVFGKKPGQGLNDKTKGKDMGPTKNSKDKVSERNETANDEKLTAPEREYDTISPINNVDMKGKSTTSYEVKDKKTGETKIIKQNISALINCIYFL